MALYVYYKVEASQAVAALAAFDQLGAAKPRLLRRAEGGPVQTWMEVYEDTLAEEAKVAACLQAFILGERHHERFEALRAEVKAS